MSKAALLFVIVGAVLAGPVPGFSRAHFFPRLQPLFLDLDESHLSARARQRLEHAKCDFARARRDQEPAYATFRGTIPFTNSRVYQGDGYRVTLVHKDLGTSHVDGPAIEIEASLTGAGPYRYDELDEVTD